MLLCKLLRLLERNTSLIFVCQYIKFVAYENLYDVGRGMGFKIINPEFKIVKGVNISQVIAKHHSTNVFVVHTCNVSKSFLTSGVPHI